MIISRQIPANPERFVASPETRPSFEHTRAVEITGLCKRGHTDLSLQNSVWRHKYDSRALSDPESFAFRDHAWSEFRWAVTASREPPPYSSGGVLAPVFPQTRRSPTHAPVTGGHPNEILQRFHSILCAVHSILTKANGTKRRYCFLPYI